MNFTGPTALLLALAILYRRFQGTFVVTAPTFLLLLCFAACTNTQGRRNSSSLLSVRPVTWLGSNTKMVRGTMGKGHHGNGLTTSILDTTFVHCKRLPDMLGQQSSIRAFGTGLRFTSLTFSMRMVRSSFFIIGHIRSMRTVWPKQLLRSYRSKI